VPSWARPAARATLTDVEAASHVKDEFLATVSHELRNPLAPILTWTQLLRSGTLDAEKTQRALEVIERNVLSQAQLIDDLVDISRVVSGKFRLDVRPIDLAPLIRVAAESQGPASDAKHIRLQLVLDDRGGMISGDSERIQQVMWNLISNAIKFTPKGGRVHVVLQRAESHMSIEVSDTGIGIAPEFLPHCVRAFRQATGGSMRRHGGLGLGLSIVRHIVEQHGGEISAQSAGLNLGSKFTVRFPVLATSMAPSEPVLRHPIARDSLVVARLGRLDGLRVLVVDDEQNSSEALSVLFHSCGADARVRRFGTRGAQHVRHVAARHPGLGHRHAGRGRLFADPQGPVAQSAARREHSRGGPDRVREDRGPRQHPGRRLPDVSVEARGSERVGGGDQPTGARPRSPFRPPPPRNSGAAGPCTWAGFRASSACGVPCPV
jgi:two-component sensor histidine kinase